VTHWVQAWAEELSRPNEVTGMAECPFAKKAWDQGAVKVVEDPDLWDAVHREVQHFGEHKVVICVQENRDQSYEELEAACAALNRWFAFKGMDIWLLSSIVDKTMVFIQALSELDSASVALEKLGYYREYEPQDYERLILQRRRMRQDVSHA